VRKALGPDGRHYIVGAGRGKLRFDQQVQRHSAAREISSPSDSSIELPGNRQPPDAFYRDIRKRICEEIRLSQQPKPAPTPEERGPIRHINPDSVLVGGWTFRLKAGFRYRLDYEPNISGTWPETETILYVGVPSGSLPDEWERFGCIGAFITVATKLEFTARGERFFVTCWGRRAIFSQRFTWEHFLPGDDSLDYTEPELTLRFKSPPVNGADSES
jgi:hypothetical protein